MRNNFQRMITLSLILLFVCSSGCEPLRKKFIRQKKDGSNTENEVIPVLEPIEYPATNDSPAKRYQYSYSMWQGYRQELITTLEEHGTDKKANYLFDVMKKQMEEMQKLLTGDQQQKIVQYITQIEQIKSQFSQPAGIRNDGAVEDKVRRLEKAMRENLNFKAVQSALVK